MRTPKVPPGARHLRTYAEFRSYLWARPGSGPWAGSQALGRPGEKILKTLDDSSEFM
jgi:hypothetical protein